MAIIVDKVQKRKDIAISCKELFFQHGINDLTISQVAKTAGVGKGTIYDYFKNKEDIVFEIVNILLEERNKKKEIYLENATSTKEKVKVFFSIFYRDEDIELRQLYKEFISISLMSLDSEMRAFHTQNSEDYYRWFKEIIQNGINSGELIEESINLTRGLFVFGDGIFISNSVTDSMQNIEEEIDIYLDCIFSLIEVKNNLVREDDK